MADGLWQLEFCARISAAIAGEDAVRGLWLSGSLARGDADELSDIDLVAVVAGASLAEVAASVEARLAREFEFVLRRNRGDDDFRLLNYVTADWERIDVSLFSLERIRAAGPSGLKVLFDKDGLSIDGGEPAKTSVSREQVEYVVTEFIRVLGLRPVVLGRGDLVGATSGCGLLRELLVTLLKYGQGAQVARGALNETSTLSSAAVAAVNGLPTLHADEASILEFNRACWAVFEEFAPAISRQYDVEWPEALVRALRRRLAAR